MSTIRHDAESSKALYNLLDQVLSDAKNTVLDVAAIRLAMCSAIYVDEPAREKTVFEKWKATSGYKIRYGQHIRKAIEEKYPLDFLINDGSVT